MKNERQKITFNGKTLFFDEITHEMMDEMKLAPFEKNIVEVRAYNSRKCRISLIAEMTGTEFKNSHSDTEYGIHRALIQSDYAEFSDDEIALAISIYYGRDIRGINGEPIADIRHTAKYLSFAFLAPILSLYGRLRIQLDKKIQNYLLGA